MEREDCFYVYIRYFFALFCSFLIENTKVRCGNVNRATKTKWNFFYLNFFFQRSPDGRFQPLLVLLRRRGEEHAKDVGRSDPEVSDSLQKRVPKYRKSFSANGSGHSTRRSSAWVFDCLLLKWTKTKCYCLGKVDFQNIWKTS